MSNVTINPAWLAFNDLINEGGEGFNPHPKWIAKTAAAVAPVATVKADRMLRDARGNTVPESKVRARLAKSLATLPTLTNASAIELFRADIAADQALLA